MALRTHLPNGAADVSFIVTSPPGHLVTTFPLPVKPHGGSRKSLYFLIEPELYSKGLHQSTEAFTMASRVVHFEIPTENPERASKFYSGVFGWNIQKWDGPQEYWLVDTGEGEPGIDGGIMRRSGPFDRVVNTVAVDDVDASTRRAQELGAQLVGEKMTIPDIGYLQYATDPDGNMFGMMQSVRAAVPS